MDCWRALVVVALGLGAASCQPSAFACQTDDACPEGRCEPQGWCSFPDPNCASGYRFGDHAVDGVAGTCVEVTDGTSTTGPVSTSTVEPSTGAMVTTSGTGTGDDDSTTAPGSATHSGSTGEVSDSTGIQTQTLVLSIAANPDDGVIYATRNGDYFFGPSGENGRGLGFFGEYPAGEYYVAYFRFEVPPELEGRTVTDARLHLTAAGPITYQWTAEHAVGVWVERSGDAPVVDSEASFPPSLGGADPSGVVLHDQFVRWPERAASTGCLASTRPRA